MKFTAFDVLDSALDRYMNLMGLKSEILCIGNYEIETWISKNNKPPLLLLHAFGVTGKYTWINQILPLAKHFKLIIPNLIYFGKSTMLEKSYSLNNQVEALSLLMKHLSINEFALGGTSYGAAVACELAYKNEFKITKMFLSNAQIKNSSEKNWQPIMNKMGISDRSEILIPSSFQSLKRFIKMAMFKRKFLPDYMIKGMYNKYYLDQYEEKKMLVNSYIEESHLFEKHKYTFTFPVLLIWGEHDYIAPLYIAEDLKNEIGANVTIVVLKKCGHLPHIERVLTYNKHLKKFLLKN